MPTVERHHSRTKPQLPSPPKRRLTTSRASGRFAYAKYLAQGDKVPLEQVTELADPDPAPIAEWYMPPGPPRFSSGARASAPTGKANRHRQGNRAGLEGRAGGDFEQVRRRRHRSPRPRRRAAVNSSPYLDVPPPSCVYAAAVTFPGLAFRLFRLKRQLTRNRSGELRPCSALSEVFSTVEHAYLFSGFRASPPTEPSHPRRQSWFPKQAGVGGIFGHVRFGNDAGRPRRVVERPPVLAH